MNILVTMAKTQVRDTFIPDSVACKLNSLGNVMWNNTDKEYTSKDLRENIKGIDICISGWPTPRFDSYVLENADKLKLIVHDAGSVAPYISEDVYKKGIKVIGGNWVFAESVAEGTLAYMLTALRDIPYYSSELQKGSWKPDDFFNESLMDRKVGVVGFGAVARYLVKFLKPFRNEIRVYDPFISDKIAEEYKVVKTSLDDIFSNSDVITVHAAQTDGTYHMIDRKLLSMIHDGALLVNASRGSIIDEDALADEIEKNRFKVLLDVYENEPLPKNSRLLGHRNAILIPHMAGPTIDRRKYVTLAMIDDITNFINGKDLKYEISKEYASKMTK